ncbi:MAG: hypothetical protein H6R02_1972, partial [Burkholderiaceae bacterium]|nr:hypothetical protein [Burkholderiaceae bacterium]
MASVAPGSLRAASLSRAWDAGVRLFGPQTSSAARERRDTLVLLFAVALVVIPHFEHLAWWATAIVVLLLVWRIWLTLAQRPLPGRFIMLPLLLAAAGAVYLEHRTLAGQDAGVTFLVLLMALKLLELRARRDLFVVIFLAFFILLTQFLYGQELQVAVITILAVVALFFVLVSVNLDEVDLPATRKLRVVGLTLLKAIPLAAALFVLFPRLSGPLWGMPGDASRGNTGLSNSMSPGSISRLLESNEIVFRARFETTPPANDRLYWRGPVFGMFNGRTWSPLVRGVNEAPAISIEADPRSAIAYEVTLEPHRRDWLFALEVPAVMPQLDGAQARLTPDMQLLASGLILERIRYEMRSYTEFRLNPRSTLAELGDWVVLPAGYNTRTLQFAEELRSRVAPGADTSSPTRNAQLMNAVLDHFRRGSYAYTLAPPALGRNSVDEFLFDTRQGFCEHYASAFVFIMRALGVPARIVTGYQGGELNPVDGFVTVRQSDAHAWSEVWLQGRGWVRVDPTAVVAPVRIDRAGGAAQQGGAALQGLGADMSLLRALRYNWEAVQNGWNQWVLSYSQERQRALVERLGLVPSLENVTRLMVVVVLLVLVWLSALTLRSRSVRDPLGVAFQLLRDRLERAGVAASSSCGPRELYFRTKRAL